MRKKQTLLKRFELSFRIFIITMVILMLSAHLMVTDEIIFPVVAITFLSAIVYMSYLVKIAAELNKNGYAWLFGCFIFPVFFHIYSYYKLKSEATKEGWYFYPRS